MAGHHSDTTSEDSLDAQYDMVDDLSEISDSLETASLLSQTEDDMVQTMSESMIAGPRDRVIDQATKQTEQHNNTQVENALLDSYVSEDLDTPRQSIITTFLKGRSFLGPLLSASQTQTKAEIERRVAFVSDEGVREDTMSDVCLRVASCLLPQEQAMDKSISRVVRCPSSHIGNRSSGFLLRMGEAEMHVEQCTSVTLDTGNDGYTKYTLNMKDDSDEYTYTFHPSSSDPKVDSPAPDLVIYYLQQDYYPAWYDRVKYALSAKAVPSITVAAPAVDFMALGEVEAEKVFNSDLVLSNEQLFHEDDEDLRLDIQELLTNRSTSAPPARQATAWSAVETVLDKCEVKLPSFANITWTRLLPIFAMLLAAIIKPYISLLDGVDTNTAISMRREALATALMTVTNSSDATAAFNISHLVPSHEDAWASRSSFPDLIPSQVRFQGVSPNHIVIALPQKAKPSWHKFPRVVSISTSRSGTLVDFNSTQLVDGVYDIYIDPKDARGLITVNMQTKNPAIDVIAEHDFGTRRRKRYEKASMELSKAINKDIMVAQKNARALGHRMGFELSAGAAATKNVTSELAVYIARDLQVLANTAVSVLHKATALGNRNAANMNKELAVVRKDLIQLSKDVQLSVISTANNAMALLPSMQNLKKPLVLSRDRAVRIGKLLARPRGTNSTSPTKDLSLRLKNIFKPAGKAKEVGSLSDIARCMNAPDYRACRKAQRKDKALTSLTSFAALSISNAKARNEQTGAKSDVLKHKRGTWHDLTHPNAVESDGTKPRKTGGKEDGKKSGKRGSTDNQRAKKRGQEGSGPKPYPGGLYF